jgi:hypothetical protein
VPVSYGEVEIDTRKRLFIAAEGLPGKGKSTFALTAPDPIVLFDIDGGLKGVIERAIAEGKKIVQPLNAKGDPERFRHYDGSNQDEWDALWNRLKECFLDAMEYKAAKSIVVDTETEMNELHRLARLGRLSQVKPHHYGPVNAEMRSLISRCKESGKNIIFTRKLKPLYIEDKRTRELEASGFGDIAFEAEVVVRMWKGGESDPDEFGLTVNKCRVNTLVERTQLVTPMSTFQFLAATVFPDTSPEEWE